MNAVAGGENEFLHLRIPTAALVAEMDAGFEELPQLCFY
jgi:hypothetical protein